MARRTKSSRLTLSSLVVIALGAISCLPAPLLAAAPAPRLSAAEAQTVRSWSRVLEVMGRKGAMSINVAQAEFRKELVNCPRASDTAGRPVPDDLQAGFEMFAGLIAQRAARLRAIAEQGPLAVDRIERLPVRSPQLRRWRTIQVGQMRAYADLASRLPASHDYCTFFAIMAKEDPMADNLPASAYIALGITKAQVDEMEAIGGTSGSATDRARRATEAFLAQRGIRKLNITRIV